MKSRFLCLLAALILLVSCDGSVGDMLFPERTCTVTVIQYENSEPVVYTVAEGSVFPEPAAHLRPGYIFLGWTCSGEPFDFSSPLSSDIVLEGVWDLNTGKASVYARLDDAAVADGTVVRLESSTVDYMGMTTGGIFMVDEALPGQYLVTVDGRLFGAMTVRYGLGGSFVADMYTVTLSADGGVTSVSGSGIYRKNDSASINAVVERGQAFSGWKDGSSVFSADAETTIPVVSKLDLTAVAEPEHYSLTFAGAEDAQSAGSIGSGHYVMSETEQWLELVLPVRHGHIVESMEVLQEEEGIRIEDGFLVIPPLTCGNASVVLQWSEHGEQVAVSFRKDGHQWSDHGKTVTLESEQDTYGFTEADISGSSVIWSSVGYGTYRVCVDGSDTGVCFTVSEGCPGSVYLDYWTVDAGKDDGIESIEGCGVYLAGSDVSLSARMCDGFIFREWTLSDTVIGQQRNVVLHGICNTTVVHASSLVDESPEILPLGGRVFLIADGYNGANYRFYDWKMNPIPSPHTVDSLSSAAYYSVSGNPEYAKYYLTGETAAPQETYMWGTYGVYSGAVSDGMGQGKANTVLAVAVSCGPDTMWENLAPGWYVGSKSEYDILFSVIPELSDIPVWSSNEVSGPTAWLHDSGKWKKAGKNTKAAMIMLRTI